MEKKKDEKKEEDAGISKVLASYQKRIDEFEAVKVYQFPLWPEPERGLPNEIIRSALFAAIRAEPNQALSNVTVATVDGFRITYTGMQLDQSHLDIFEGIMHLARGVPEGNRIIFSRHGLLKLIGRNNGKSDHEWLKRNLQRLTATSVHVERAESKGYSRLFWGSLLPGGAFDGETGKFMISLNRELIKLFDRGFTRIQWSQRAQLRRKPLAQWLHLYYSSHAQPYSVSVSFLRKLSGTRTDELKHFRANLKTALNELQNLGVLTSWEITARDLVKVQRAAPQRELPGPQRAAQARDTSDQLGTKKQR